MSASAFLIRDGHGLRRQRDISLPGAQDKIYLFARSQLRPCPGMQARPCGRLRVHCTSVRTAYASDSGGRRWPSHSTRADGPIWARPEPAARSPRFSRQQIAAAALEIADAEGFEAVSMRRIARSLGAGTMSLYRYITTKDDLLALVGDALLGEALVAGELPCRLARGNRRRWPARQGSAYLRHPWAVHLVQRQGRSRRRWPDRTVCGMSSSHCQRCRARRMDAAGEA